MSEKTKACYSAFDTAIYYLTFRDRSRKELITKLKEKGYSESEIEDTVEKLLRYGYLNDERYALSYIKSHIQSRGRKRITLELSGKGVDSETTRELFSDFSLDETDTILQLIEKRYSNLDFDEETQVRRMYAFFARRGFRYEDIRRAVSKYRKNIEKN